MEWPVSDIDVLAFVGVKQPTEVEQAWAKTVADAVNNGIMVKLNGNVVPQTGEAEMRAAALIASAEAYKRREAIFGVTGYQDMEGAAIRIARDYLSGVEPLINRYGAGPGIG